MALRLLVVTPARNEASYLPSLIEAVKGQTRTPDRWIVVDDGSDDGTGDVVRDACLDLPWVQVVRRDRSALGRGDASKAGCLNSVVRPALTADTEIIVVLDADVVPPPNFLESVETAFAEDARLGVFGGVYTFHALRGIKPEPFPRDHVPGGAQALRRSAYEDIGGFMPMRFGGIDTAACVAAQFHGWTTRHDPRLVCEHLRPIGTGEGQSLRRGMYKRGREDYDLGAPWWFEMGKCVRWLPRRPLVSGSIWMAAGFAHSTIARTPRTPPPEFVAFNRRRARTRISGRLRGVLHR